MKNSLRAYIQFIDQFNYTGAMGVYNNHYAACWKSLELFDANHKFHAGFDSLCNHEHGATNRAVIVLKYEKQGFLLDPLTNRIKNTTGMNWAFYRYFIDSKSEREIKSRVNEILWKSRQFRIPALFGFNLKEYCENLKTVCHFMEEQEKNYQQFQKVG